MIQYFVALPLDLVPGLMKILREAGTDWGEGFVVLTCEGLHKLREIPTGFAYQITSPDRGSHLMWVASRGYEILEDAPLSARQVELLAASRGWTGHKITIRASGAHVVGNPYWWTSSVLVHLASTERLRRA